MKITIELSDAEVKGIKAYIEDTDGEKPTREDIKRYIQGIVSGTINSDQEAVSDYIRQFEKQ